MRVPVRNPFSSARPTRGALLATLFAIITAAMLVAFGNSDESAPLIATGAEEAASAPQTALSPAPEVGPTTTTTEAPTETSAADGANLRANVQDPISFLEGEQVAWSKEYREPASPTTVQPTTTRPPTTAAPTTAEDTTTSTDETTSSTEAAADGEGDPATTTTTEATTSTSADNGWVDSGNGVLMPPVMLSIRYCESRDNYTAANPSSSARGAYQFLTGSWEWYGHAARYGVGQAHLATPAQQDEAALITWQQDGTTPWNASRHCWG